MSKKFKPLAVEREIVEEMASTLGRIGSEFSKRHQRAWAAWRAWEKGGEFGEKIRQRLERALHHAMDEAERYRYFLIVQREAMGLRNHAEVNRKYPLPRVPGRPPGAGDPTSPRLAWPGGFSRGWRRKFSG
ncbi:MAG: hypothetical protein F4X91_15570 [Nitrospinae bacterium]|nr:hypothetical protein [Nitrospinota bacterium]